MRPTSLLPRLARQRRSSWRLLALLLTLSLFAAACGDDDDEPSADGGGSGGGSSEEVSGEVIISGSSTVEPISALVAENFQADNPDVTPNVDGPGTGDGFELFCNGETDISDASRPIDPEEQAACEENGIEFIELRVAFDGISVLTSPENDAVSCLTFEDLYALVGPESEGVDNWSDAQELASELGSTTELPDAPLEITAPGEESGTYDSFIEIALGDIAEARLEEGAITEEQVETTRPDYTSSSDDNVIIEGIGGSASSFGWVGFAFAENAGDTVKEIEIDGGDGCTAPSADTISDESYPLSRPLFIYVNSQQLEENPALRPFVEYYLSEDGLAAVEETGYVPLPEDQLEETTTAFEDGTTGTREASE